MARKRNPVVQWLLYQILRLFGFVTLHIPLGWARALGRSIGWLAYHCVPRVGSIARKNLDLAYGDSLTTQEKRRIGIGAAQNACIVAAEFSRLPHLRGDRARALIRVIGADRVDRSRGAFLISAHLGNWEWMMPAVMSLGWPTAGIVRPLDYAPLNTWVSSRRTSTGIRTIDKTGSGPEMMRLLRAGWMVGILADQSPREAGVPVTFFGQPCWATVAPAMIAARAKVPIHVAAIVRQPDGNYEMEFSEPIELDRSKPLRAGLVDVSQQCQDVIERLVRAHPEQWLWLHRRWKERPRLAREWAAKDSADAQRRDAPKSGRPVSN